MIKVIKFPTFKTQVITRVHFFFLNHTKKKKNRYYPSKSIRQDAKPWLFRRAYEN